MKRLYFLGLAANYSRRARLRHFFSFGKTKHYRELEALLRHKYGGEVVLTKNGRSALAMAMRAYFNKGDAVLVNGFTCFAVYEAAKAAGITPVFVDIEKTTLNFSTKTLRDALKRAKQSGLTVRGVVIQNTLGNPVDIEEIQVFAKSHNLEIIEDLAHCAGVRYANDIEAGCIGAATVLSFGKEKAVDCVSGGALILRHPCKHAIQAPEKLPKLSDHLRARFYPTLGALCRTLTHIHLGGVLMRLLLKIHFVERSADNRLDLTRKISKFEAKMATAQIKNFKKSGEPPLRDYYLVNDREELLEELARAGYYFNGFWYEKPVSPARYYKKVHFDEKACPVATEVAQKIINLPHYYSAQDLSVAKKIIGRYTDE